MAEPRSASGNTTAAGKTAVERAHLQQELYGDLSGREHEIVSRMRNENPFVGRISEEDMDYIRSNYKRLKKYGGDYFVDEDGNDATIGGKIWYRVGIYGEPDETDVLVSFETKERRKATAREENNGYSVFDYRRKR